VADVFFYQYFTPSEVRVKELNVLKNAAIFVSIPAELKLPGSSFVFHPGGLEIRIARRYQTDKSLF